MKWNDTAWTSIENHAKAHCEAKRIAAAARDLETRRIARGVARRAADQLRAIAFMAGDTWRSPTTRRKNR